MHKIKVITVLLYFCLAGCSQIEYLKNRIQLNESVAYGKLMNAKTEQSEHFLKHGRFATNDEMKWLKKEVNGYVYEMITNKKSFKIWATPKEYAVTGNLSFYVDANGEDVRGADHKGEKATDKDPVIEIFSK